MKRRLIDANALECYRFETNDAYRGLVEVIPYGLIETAPTIDAVEVVRCRECKHCLVQIPLPDGYLYCQELNRAVSDNDYCSRGVRREPDANNLHG